MKSVFEHPMTPFMSRFLMLQVVLFFWYYVTLPGSIIPPKDNKSTKPSIMTALIRFIMFMIPYYILFGAVYYKLKNKDTQAKLCDAFMFMSEYMVTFCKN